MDPCRLTQRPTPPMRCCNQAPPLAPYNVFEADTAAAARRWSARAAAGASTACATPARWPARAEAHEHSERCERNEPVLRTHDRYGNRVDEVELDPSWHWLLREAIERGIHSLPWRDPQPGAHTVRAGADVRLEPGERRRDVPGLDDLLGDPRAAREPRPGRGVGAAAGAPPDYDKGALAGMAMTEKQGGSDVRANTTRAEPQATARTRSPATSGSAPTRPCDVFLTLAQAPDGLSCFLIEGARPRLPVQRLKDKLGTRSLPSSEVEFLGVRGRLVGEEGRGVPTIIRMVNHTRLDCLIGSAASMRWGTAQAVHHARHRSAFGNAARRPARDAERAGRPGDRVRGRHRHRDADGARLRRGRRGLPPLRHRGVEVLGVQARAAARRRGARVPGRQRLRGGVGHAAALPRLPAQLDLGGLGQRGRARRAARDGQGARGPAGLPGEVRAGRGRRRAPGRPRGRAEGSVWPACGDQDPQFAARRMVEDLGLALQASLLVRNAPAAGGRRVLRLAAGPRGRPRVRHAARGRRRRGDRGARAAPA